MSISFAKITKRPIAFLGLLKEELEIEVALGWTLRAHALLTWTGSARRLGRRESARLIAAAWEPEEEGQSPAKLEP